MNDYTIHEFDIVLQAGQSNSEGCGLGAAEEYLPSSSVLFMHGDLSVTPAAERESPQGKVNDFSLSFCAEYIRGGKLKPGRRLLVLRAAVGGTGFSDKRWGPEDDLCIRMHRMIKTALSLNPANRLAAFIWHQGETDASYKAGYETHYRNLKNLIDGVRNGYGCPSLPFAAGDFVHEWKNANTEICEPVVRAIRDVCRDIGFAAFADTDGLKSNNQDSGNGDTIHFCRDALNSLGRIYYNSIARWITGPGE